MPSAYLVAQGGGSATKRRASEPVNVKGSGVGSTGNGGSSSRASEGFNQAGGSSSRSSIVAGSSGGAVNGHEEGSSGSGNQAASSAAVMKMKAEVFEKDRENFLTTFEKPTQIYKVIRARMVARPIFLQRNLGYMKSRMSRTHKSRIGFSVDLMLPKKEKQEKESKIRQLSIGSPRRGFGLLNTKTTVNFYNIIVMGVSDGQMWLPDTKARIDICIAKICLKKRKDGIGPVSKIFEQCLDLKIYSPSSPRSSHEITIPLPQKCPVASVPASDCSLGTNGHTVRSYKLAIRVTIPLACLQNNKLDQQSNNHLNNRNDNSNDGLEEPKAKRRRSAPTTKDRENFIYEGDGAKGSGGGAGTGRSGDPSEDCIVYTGAVSLYERDIPGDKIREADVDLQMKKQTRGTGQKMSFQRMRREITWENLDEKHSKVLDQAKPAGKCAKLTVAIRTSSEKPSQFIEPPPPLLTSVLKEDDGASDDSTSNQSCEKKSVRIIYHFIYGNISQQQTECRDDFRCAWCSLDCLNLYSLMKHLKTCHSRFNFNFSPIPNGAKIDITVNDSYDGSYSGSAFDLVTQPPGEAFARNGPTKRTEVFSILVCRPKPHKDSLQEFFECDEKDVDQRRTYITGHNRLYHHTSTCLPIHPREIDVDSEGEPDPEWLRVKTTMMIDEFTDVNEGEKELMKLWNLHVMKYNYVGDCQIPLACQRFVELHGKQIIRKNLYRNFCLHLINLFDFGLLNSQGVHSTISNLHSQMKEANSAPVHLFKYFQGDCQNKNGVNGTDPKVTPGTSKSLPSLPNTGTSHSQPTTTTAGVSASKAGSSLSGNVTASTTSLLPAICNTANNTNVMKPNSPAITALATCKKLEVKVQKIGTPSSPSVGTRNSTGANK